MSRLLADYQFDLPPDRIARTPAHPRDSARLMVVDRSNGSLTHAHFRDLGCWIGAEDLLLLNDTRVLPARLSAENGAVEILLTEETSPRHWLAIGKPGKKLKPGARLVLDALEPGHAPVTVEVLKTLPDAQRVIRFHSDVRLEDYGRLPLPPYILQARADHQQPEYLPEDNHEYQTVYARESGSVASPTAGLHFTPELLATFPHAFLTLHVGLGTFRPVKVADVSEHEMHGEHYRIPAGLAERAAVAKRVVAVGTTVCRVIETAPKLQPSAGLTTKLIYPPYTFRRTDALITNFHLPGSTLLMLVAALTGIELQRKAYAEAVREGYRFYSYGDAMLIV
ncbi:MAG: tRNA preQ1(34) S-adenosylmethionine ribosyltransferase-isomerase QueA [Candidatus Methylacidiphilales bacterium]|nr:tRNA preQ1(34) S-adenosylmethionine ribosyltransferase-isomerase QueA [Candidatus Methylacidiphilales bacterium]